MPCLLALLAVFTPRLAFIVVWLARPNLVSSAFGDFFLWPLLGVIFVPFTALVYVLLYHPGVGVVGWGWLWVGLAFLVDISHWLGAYTQRSYATRYSGGVSA
jgi:hypothetical protein